MAVILTENVAREVATICSQQDLELENVYLRVGVRGGGCSGFSYLLDLTEVSRETDEMWEVQHGEGEGDTAVVADKIRVICDPKSYLYLNGTEIDFKDEIMGRGFVFNNPNANTTCGCGSSFSA